jgi:hypothetical protein
MSEWLQTFNIFAFAIESELSTVYVDTRLNGLRADIEWALAKDATVWTRGNLAEDTILIGANVDTDVDLTAHLGYIEIIVNVRYRTFYNDPYTSIYS